MTTMTKDDLFKKPIVMEESGSWESKRRLSRSIDLQTMAFVAAGGMVTQVVHQTVAEIKPLYNNKAISPEHQDRATKASKHCQLNKDLARENGNKTFVGMRCKKCGDKYERWTENSACTTCNPDDPSLRPKAMARKSRAAAQERGEEVYNGAVCGICQTTRRHMDTGSCIQCKGPEYLRVKP